MGTGDFLCISMTGGAPWGFRLHGGKEQNQPLQVAKIRGKSKASGSGLREGDEVVSINGTPCTDLTYSEVIKLMENITDSLQMLIKRPSSGINETYIPETANKEHDHLVHEDHVERTSLQIWPHCTQSQRAFPGQKDEKSPDCSGETKPSPQIALHPPRRPWAESIVLGEIEGGRPGAVVELQLSLLPDRHKDPGASVGIIPEGAESHPSPDPHPDQLQGGFGQGTSAFSDEKEDSGQGPSDKLIQLSSGQELHVTQGREAGAPHLSKAEVVINYSYDAEKAEGSNWAGRKGCGDFQVEGGRAEAPPSVVSFPLSSEGPEQGEDQQISERDHRRPHKHRARHARFRRSESLSEKQVKEAKSKCKSIALLLTNALNPNSKGVLMFKKRRRRAKKYTLISYGTGELQREADTEEESEKDGLVEVKFTSESEVDEEIVSDADDDKEAPVWTSDWDSGLVDVEKKLKSGDKMQMLPDSSGKGVLMFAKRRERMDQITAQQGEVKAEGVARGEFEGGQADGLRTVTSYQTREEESMRMQSNVAKSYLEGSHTAQQNGLSGAPDMPEAHRLAASNRTAKPFPGSANQAAVPFSPTRNLGSPLYDFPAPPPYSAVTPPPEVLSRGVTSPVAAPAQPPPWPQPAPWAQQAFYEPTEQIASRDERIAVPAKRTGILQEARRRGASKPMFTFKEHPKVSPNPELLSLVQNAEGKRGPGAGFESGPEEDYLSLGAEACNFMQGHSSKQKTPPPVAPKPSAKPSPSQPVTPVSPVWSPSTAAPSQPPAFPVSNRPQGIVASAIKIARPASTAYQPPSAPSVAGPFKGPQAAVASVNYTPKVMPAGNATPVSGAGPPSELPEMRGKGAQLFAKRQSRMEKYVVDSEKVQAHMARAQSPTPSLPASWKYSSNVRAPPPVAYNPILSPSYPPAAIKQQPGAAAPSKPGKKRGKKPLNALDVMKHQPYQLDASLFTFQPPDAKDGPVPKPLAKLAPVPVLKPAPSSQPVNASSAPTFRASSVCSVPAYSAQPTYYSEAAATPVSPSLASPVSPVHVALPTSPKPESAPATYFVAPRPKFSAKRSGVTVQGGGQSLPCFGRPIAATVSPTSPLMFQPSPSYPSKPVSEPAKVNKRLTPWEAAAKSPLGLVDDAFGPRSIQESIVANVVSAAQRKSLPEPLQDWKPRVSYAPQAQKANLVPFHRREKGIPNLPQSTRAATYAKSQYDAPLPHFNYHRKPSRTGMMMETRSEYGYSFRDGNYNPHPRGWKRET
ncbi:synaptopodin-2 isoform X1 [Phascolarctos cinereus]|uniref:Synaptopodin-2 n=2 Tax=Phascolarctos cinereus TaxID=38626 RepID=A0A6P5M2I1_PHACI|nr:synaptopodin-2 isoform X1 [Phascolarctos cinereus]